MDFLPFHRLWWHSSGAILPLPPPSTSQTAPGKSHTAEEREIKKSLILHNFSNTMNYHTVCTLSNLVNNICCSLYALELSLFGCFLSFLYNLFMNFFKELTLCPLLKFSDFLKFNPILKKQTRTLRDFRFLKVLFFHFQEVIYVHSDNFLTIYKIK